jgi:hypothetical protein
MAENVCLESPKSESHQTEAINNVQVMETAKQESKKASNKDKNIKQDSCTEIEGSLPVPSAFQLTQAKDNNEYTFSDKNEGNSDLKENIKNQKSDIGKNSEKNQNENVNKVEKSRKISILGQNYVGSTPTVDIFNNETFTQESTTEKKESRGFLSDEEREELEKENALVKAIKEFQAQSSTESTHSEVSSHILSEGELSTEVQYSQLEKDIIKKSMDAQQTIKTALEDIEKPNSSNQTRHTVTQVTEDKVGDFGKTETIRVQKHSLSIQDGVVIEQTSTERFPSQTSGSESQEDSCTIDPDSLRNVDGPAKQRKGSSRFSKRQGSKSKSPGLGNQSSLSGPDDREEDEEAMNNTDLTTRLEETNVRMKKLSEVFNVMCDDPRVEPYHKQEHEAKTLPHQDTNPFDTEGRQTSFHPLTRTTQIIRKECPLDEVIGTMIQKPENLSSSSQFSSSVENNLSSPVMYRAVVTQPHEEKEEDLL